MIGRGNSQLVRVEIRVTGRVQGVAFRWHTRQQASKLGVVGLVRNLPNGSVDIIAEGERCALEALCDWARHGPDPAHVESQDVAWVAAEGIFIDFRIAG